ncbi:GNAT family N-acetyltransferase [Pseudoalteromonas mariniglutinosa]|uniref:GNAT family N-acetyltransferase n=1 Tax=Pseudoalteromonas mariniglutinosa TaxID=206042 RepID=UPI003850B61B
MNASLRFTELEIIKRPLVNKFYDKQGARGRAKRTEQVWVCYLDNEIIAACRIQKRQHYLLLCGVYVDPNWRQQRVASRLITLAMSAQTQSVFSFVYKNLIDFYKLNGFNCVLTLPAELATLFTLYERRNIVAMQYKC